MTPQYRAEKLKGLLDDMKAKGYKSYASIERNFDVSASYLSQIVNGTRDLGENAARTIESKMDLPAFYFDKDLDTVDADIAAHVDSTAIYSKDLFSDEYDSKIKISIYDNTDKESDSFIDLNDGIISEGFFKERGINKDNFKIIKAHNDSNAPFINDNDIVGIDVSERDIKDGNIYAIAVDSDIMIKQIFREPAGALRFHCFNDKYPDLVFSKNDLKSVKVIGKQVYRAG